VDVVAVGVLKCTALLDRENLLPCGECRVQFGDSEFREP